MKIVLLFLITMALTLSSSVGFASDVTTKTAELKIEKVEKITVDSVNQVEAYVIDKVNLKTGDSLDLIKFNTFEHIAYIGSIGSEVVNKRKTLSKKLILFSLNEHKNGSLNYLYVNNYTNKVNKHPIVFLLS